MSNIKNAGFVRVSDLMIRMMDAAERKDKEILVRLSEHFAEDCGDFVELILREAQVTPDDISKFSMSEEQEDQLLKIAGSASQMRKEARARTPSVPRSGPVAPVGPDH